MRATHLSRSLGAVLAVSTAITFAVACAAPNSDDENAASSEAELAKRTVDGDPPRPPVKPPPPPKDAGTKPPIKQYTTLPGQLAVGLSPEPAPPAYCGTTQYDLRRITRTCENLPGAFVDANGVTYVPGVNGRFKVERSLAAQAASAPAELVAKTCSFTWEPASCGALPDTSVLLIEAPTEQVVPRAPGCTYLPDNGCGIVTPPPKVDGGSPTGIGRCEVCGYASSTDLWAVIPDQWTSFSYVAGGQRKFVQLTSSQSYYHEPLPASVNAQDVTIYKYDSAPQ